MRLSTHYYLLNGVKYMKVVFSTRAFAALMAETTEKIETETGGLFLGTVENDTWYVIESIDPGPKSIFEVAYFEYDQKYTQHLINKIANLYNEKLSLIGLWHRHPGSFDIFSSTDNGTNAKYAKMRECGAISALVNIDPTFRLTMYHVAQPCKYSKISYVVGDELIPEKYMELKTPEKYEKIMENILNPSNNTSTLTPSVSLKSFMEKIKPLFLDRKIKGKVDKPKISPNELKDLLIDGIVDDISFLSDQIGIEMSIVQKNGLLAFVQDTVDGVTKIFFVYSQKENKIIFQFDGDNYIYDQGLFQTLYEMSTEDTNVVETVKPEILFEQTSRNIFDGVIHIFGFNRKEDDE